MARKRLLAGVILQIPLTNDLYGYAQYIHSGKGLNYGISDVIQVFDVRSPARLRPDDLRGRASMFPPVFVGVRWAIAHAGWGNHREVAAG
jgi:hypothetical protein